MDCLIVVDMQRDFLPEGKLAVKGGDEIIERINRLQDTYPLVVATQDWHPSGHRSFASAHAGRNPFEVLLDGTMEQVLWPDHCVQNTEGAEFDARLRTERFEAIFRKGTDPLIDSYSGFFDNQRKKSTGLAGYLRDKGVTSVSVCGLAADYCVFYTAMDALDLGFRATILESAVRAIDAVGYARKRSEFSDREGAMLSDS